jgi:hypothetical protein
MSKSEKQKCKNATGSFSFIHVSSRKKKEKKSINQEKKGFITLDTVKLKYS